MGVLRKYLIRHLKQPPFKAIFAMHHAENQYSISVSDHWEDKAGAGSWIRGTNLPVVTESGCGCRNATRLTSSSTLPGCACLLMQLSLLHCPPVAGVFVGTSELCARGGGTRGVGTGWPAGLAGCAYRTFKSGAAISIIMGRVGRNLIFHEGVCLDQSRDWP